APTGFAEIVGDSQNRLARSHSLARRPQKSVFPWRLHIRTSEYCGHGRHFRLAVNNSRISELRLISLRAFPVPVRFEGRESAKEARQTHRVRWRSMSSRTRAEWR